MLNLLENVTEISVADMKADVRNPGKFLFVYTYDPDYAPHLYVEKDGSGYTGAWFLGCTHGYERCSHVVVFFHPKRQGRAHLYRGAVERIVILRPEEHNHKDRLPRHRVYFKHFKLCGYSTKGWSDFWGERRAQPTRVA
ncbi:MAG: hypothetical protein GDA55_01430 [Cellvibrionales bacterium]|nr:hypothetical protein [Cellvibrionales bacterium]